MDNGRNVPRDRVAQSHTRQRRATNAEPVFCATEPRMPQRIRHLIDNIVVFAAILVKRFLGSDVPRSAIQESNLGKHETIDSSNFVQTVKSHTKLETSHNAVRHPPGMSALITTPYTHQMEPRFILIAYLAGRQKVLPISKNQQDRTAPTASVFRLQIVDSRPPSHSAPPVQSSWITYAGCSKG